MPKIGDYSISGSDSDLPCGVAFTLRDASRSSQTIIRKDRSRVTVVEHSKYVIAEINSPGEYLETLNSGYLAAQEGLDMLSISARGDLSILNSHDEHLVWWKDRTLAVLRVVGTASMPVSVNVSFTVRDKNGNIKPQSPPGETLYHTAFRYYRLSQVSDKLFDAYRNLYLAFENLLSTYSPKQKESEVNWLERSLSKLEEEKNIIGRLGISATMTVKELLDLIYHKTRCALFHAKNEQLYSLPEKRELREPVLKALEVLTPLFLEMAKVMCNIQRHCSYVYSKPMYKKIVEAYSQCHLIISDDPSEVDLNQRDLLHQRYRTAYYMATEVLPLALEEVPAVLGVSTEKLPALAYRFELVTDRWPLQVLRLEEGLQLDGFDRVECVLKTNVRNLQQPTYTLMD